MSQNPLQNYFRQPKIYIKLPTLGKYNEPGIISGNVENLPIFGMTGMDQIIIKTPDALLSGESTVRVIQSCCPSILNAWELTNMDVDSLLVAIRIATYGNLMSITSVCKSCSAENAYEIDISEYISHFDSCKFNTNVVVDGLVVKLKPLTYKSVTAFSMENFSLQRQLSQLANMDDENLQQDEILRLYADFGILKNKLLTTSIDYVETPNGQVSEYGYIKEWIENCDKSISDKIRDAIDDNNAAWKVPPKQAKCHECGETNVFAVDLDHSNFFDQA